MGYKLCLNNEREFIKELKELVESEGYESVSKRTKISQRSIRRMFKEGAMPTLKSVLDLAQALGFELDYRKVS